MLEFAWPWVFIILPLPFLIRLLPAVQQNEAALRVPFLDDLEADVASSEKKTVLNQLLLVSLLIWLGLVTAASRPQWLGESVALPTTGRDLLMAVDISGSMAEEDFEWRGREITRLDAVKLVAGDFIEQRIGDRIGLVLFGDRAYVQVPLSFDRKTVKHFLYESAVGLAGKATSMGDAIGLSVKRLRERPQDSRVMVLLTDGHNTAGEVEPRQAAKMAAQAGVKIYTIGVGGAPRQVRGFFGVQTVNPSRDLDEGLLKEIAGNTGGKYFRAHDTDELKKIYALLDEYEPTLGNQQTYRPMQALYSWPLGFSLLLSLLLLWQRGRQQI